MSQSKLLTAEAIVERGTKMPATCYAHAWADCLRRRIASFNNVTQRKTPVNYARTVDEYDIADAKLDAYLKETPPLISLLPGCDVSVMDKQGLHQQGVIVQQQLSDIELTNFASGMSLGSRPQIPAWMVSVGESVRPTPAHCCEMRPQLPSRLLPPLMKPRQLSAKVATTWDDCLSIYRGDYVTTVDGVLRHIVANDRYCAVLIDSTQTGFGYSKVEHVRPEPSRPVDSGDVAKFATCAPHCLKDETVAVHAASAPDEDALRGEVEEILTAETDIAQHPTAPQQPTPSSTEHSPSRRTEDVTAAAEHDQRQQSTPPPRQQQTIPQQPTPSSTEHSPSRRTEDVTAAAEHDQRQKSTPSPRQQTIPQQPAPSSTEHSPSQRRDGLTGAEEHDQRQKSTPSPRQQTIPQQPAPSSTEHSPSQRTDGVTVAEEDGVGVAEEDKKEQPTQRNASQRTEDVNATAEPHQRQQSTPSSRQQTPLSSRGPSPSGYPSSRSTPLQSPQKVVPAERSPQKAPSSSTAAEMPSANAAAARRTPPATPTGPATFTALREQSREGDMRLRLSRPNSMPPQRPSGFSTGLQSLLTGGTTDGFHPDHSCGRNTCPATACTCDVISKCRPTRHLCCAVIWNRTDFGDGPRGPYPMKQSKYAIRHCTRNHYCCTTMEETRRRKAESGEVHSEDGEVDPATVDNGVHGRLNKDVQTSPATESTELQTSFAAKVNENVAAAVERALRGHTKSVMTSLDKRFDLLGEKVTNDIKAAFDNNATSLKDHLVEETMKDPDDTSELERMCAAQLELEAAEVGVRADQQLPPMDAFPEQYLQVLPEDQVAKIAQDMLDAPTISSSSAASSPAVGYEPGGGARGNFAVENSSACQDRKTRKRRAPEDLPRPGLLKIILKRQKLGERTAETTNRNKTAEEDARVSTKAEGEHQVSATETATSEQHPSATESSESSASRKTAQPTDDKDQHPPLTTTQHPLDHCKWVTKKPVAELFTVPGQARLARRDWGGEAMPLEFTYLLNGKVNISAGIAADAAAAARTPPQPHSNAQFWLVHCERFCDSVISAVTGNKSLRPVLLIPKPDKRKCDSLLELASRQPSPLMDALQLYASTYWPGDQVAPPNAVEGARKFVDMYAISFDTGCDMLLERVPPDLRVSVLGHLDASMKAACKGRKAKNKRK